MVEYRMLKRTVLLLAAILGCLCAVVGLMFSAGATRLEKAPALTGSEAWDEITLPCRVEGTSLIAKQLVVYEGPSLELGSDMPISDVTALVLYNGGEREIAQAEVILAGEKELTFFASNILPGAQVLVIEKNAAAWEDWVFTACTGWANETEAEPLSEEVLQIRQIDMGTLSVTNLSTKPLQDIWLFYKNYLPDAKLYVGGITYIETIPSLEPGQTVLINPAQYAAGYSRILKAQAVP